jgi:hypothetical protein
VPISQVSYERVAADGFDGGVLTIAFEDERELRGKMRYATAGYGPYYQIRVFIDEAHPLFLLPTGTIVTVTLERAQDGGKVVRIARLES